MPTALSQLTGNVIHNLAKCKYFQKIPYKEFARILKKIYFKFHTDCILFEKVNRGKSET